MPYFGVHQSISAGFDAAVFDTSAMGFDCVQIFSGNSNRWVNKAIDPKAAAKFQAALQKTGQAATLIHDSYLINLASPDEENHAKSIKGFTDELVRAAALGVTQVVMHPGAAKEDTKENAIARVARSFDQIFESLPGNEVKVLIETTAGQGSYLGGPFEEIAAIIEASAHQDRFGVCLDTCHVFAAGHDIRTRETYDATFDAFDRIVGLERLCAFHLNDSVKGLGSHVDRHAHIGHGAIGLEAFRMIVNDPRFVNLPMYMETPKEDNEQGEPWDVVNLKTLKSLIE